MTPAAVAPDQRTSTDPCTTCPIRRQHQSVTPGTKRRPQRKLDIKTELTLICAYCHGASTQDLAHQYHVAPSTITTILHTYHYPLRTLITPHRTRRHSPTQIFPLSDEVLSLLRYFQAKPSLPYLIVVAILTEGAAGYHQTGHLEESSNILQRNLADICFITNDRPQAFAHVLRSW
jgi:hypothetical protein